MRSSEIAKNFGVSIDAIQGACLRYHIPSPIAGRGLKLRPDQRRALIKFRRMGMTGPEIARELGVTPDIIYNRLKCLPNRGDIGAEEVEAGPEKLLEHLILGHELVRANDIRNREVFIDLKTPAKYIGLAFLGDLHIDHYKTDVQSIVDALESLGKSPNVHVIINGDFGDNSEIRFNPEGYHMPSIVLPLDMRMKIMHHLISKIPNLLSVTAGDHDLWVKNRAFDMIAELTKKTNADGHMTKYLGPGGFINLTVNSLPYRLGVYHRFKTESALNDFHPCMKFLQLMDASCDIVSIAHRHDKSGIQFCHYQGMPKVLIRTGSAQYLTDWAWKEGFFGAINRSPMVFLGADKREMLIAPDYKQGLRMLEKLNAP
jgi:hypothetical protein